MPKADFTADSLLARLQPSARSAVQSQLAAQDARVPRRNPAKRAECPLAARMSEAVLAKMVVLPIRVLSTNRTSGEHWSRRAKRAKEQRLAVYLKLLSEVPLPALPVRVILKREGKKLFDSHDNLRASMKNVADAVADAYDIKDDDKRIEWDYAQEITGRYMVWVTIERKEGGK